jgi:hypothetical protein
MWEDLASIREVVDLSPQEALDSAQNFLIERGYDVTNRTGTMLGVERQDLGSYAEHHGALSLVVVAVPQPEGGVRIMVSGNDLEGVRERQAEWVEWSEGLPKRKPPPVREEAVPVGRVRHGVHPMQALSSLCGEYNIVKFWVISGLITVGSALVLPNALRDLSKSSEPGYTLFLALLVLIAVFGVCLLPFALWQHVQRERFFDG